MVATGDGHTNIVQLLLEHDADNNLQDKVSSSAKTVCLTAVHLTYSTTIIVFQVALLASLTSATASVALLAPLASRLMAAQCVSIIEVVG